MSWFVFTLRFRSVKTILGYFDQLNFTPNCHNYYIAVTHSIIVTTSHRPIQLVTANATARCSYAGLMCHISSRLYYWICKIQRSWWICYLLFTPKCSKAFSFRGWSPPPPLGALPPDPHYGLALAICPFPPFEPRTSCNLAPALPLCLGWNKILATAVVPIICSSVTNFLYL